MSRKFWGPALLLTLVFGVDIRSHASTTATITVSGAEQSGDANTVTVAFNGFVETALYGQYSTSASIASALAAMFSRDYLQAGLCASVAVPGGSTINFKLRGGAPFGVLDVTGSTTSFHLSSSGFASQGSTANSDTGTVTLTVGGHMAAQTNYGQGATPDSIAAGLAKAAQGSYVSVTASGNSIFFQATPSYQGTDYSFSLTSSWNTSLFSQPSFGGSPASGALQGGAGTSGSQPQIYTYNGVSYDGVGNITGFTDSVMGSWSSIGYDALNRLTSATVGSNAPAPYTNNFGCWKYDNFGNRTSEAVSTTPCSNNPPLMSWASYTTTSTNRMDSTSLNTNQRNYYDAAGNITNDGRNSYLYDTEGRVCAVSLTVNGTTFMTGYLYDAEGIRIAKGTLQNMNSCDPGANGFQLTSVYALGPSGEQMAEMEQDADGDWEWQHTNVWAGRLLATYQVAGPSLPNPNDPGSPLPNSTLHFYLDDPLGSRRVQTDYAGVVEQTCQSLPYGDGETCSPSPTEHLFTGKERDAESGNDYFPARYYSSAMGRWISPDPSQLMFANLANPQTFNLYGYAANSPLVFIDPTGLWMQFSCNTVDKGFDPPGNSVGVNSTTTCNYWDDGRGRLNTQIPQHQQQSMNHLPAHAPCSNIRARVTKGAEAMTNALSLYLKARALIAANGIAVAVAPETEGASLIPAAVGDFYEALSAPGQMLDVVAEGYTAITGDFEHGEEMEQAGDIASAPILGYGTLIATKGNAASAQQAAQRENYITASNSLAKSLVEGRSGQELLGKGTDYGLSLLGITGDGCE